MGPLGIPIGATAGGLYSYSRSKGLYLKRVLTLDIDLLLHFVGSFKSAAVILKDDMTVEQQEKLCKHIFDAFKDFQLEDISMLIPLIMANGQLQTMVIAQVVEFLTKEMRMQIID